jgi:hypothetical protein
MAGIFTEIVMNEITFALRDWISRRLGWIKSPRRQLTAEQRERARIRERRARDRRNRRRNRG